MNIDFAPNVETKVMPGGVFSAFLDSHPGCWGLGATVWTSLDDLAECLPGWHRIGDQIDCNCSWTFTEEADE